MLNLDPKHIQTDSCGKVFRHVVLTLQPGQSMAELRETPSAFKRVQQSRDKKILRSDFISVIENTENGGTRTYYKAPVTSCEGPDVYLGKPQHVIDQDPVVLYSADPLYEVVPNGVRYSIRDKRSDHIDQLTFESVASATREIDRRHPKHAA